MKPSIIAIAAVAVIAAACSEPVSAPGNQSMREFLPERSAAVAGAAYTTFAVASECIHGSAVNCNLYQYKTSVYLNGGPLSNPTVPKSIVFYLSHYIRPPNSAGG